MHPRDVYKRQVISIYRGGISGRYPMRFFAASGSSSMSWPSMMTWPSAVSYTHLWLDCIMLFPLILLGLEQLVKEKKGTLYCITLGLSILSNYYISIMICIFTVI